MSLNKRASKVKIEAPQKKASEAQITVKKETDAT